MYFERDCRLLAQRATRERELMLAERVLERRLQVHLVERLAHVIGRAELHRPHDRDRAPLARQDDHGHVAVDLLERGERLEPVHTAGHHDVEDHGRGAIGAVVLDGLLRRCRS